MSESQEIREQIEDMKGYLPQYKESKPDLYQKILKVIDDLQVRLLIAEEQEEKEKYYE